MSKLKIATTIMLMALMGSVVCLTGYAAMQARQSVPIEVQPPAELPPMVPAPARPLRARW